MQVSTKISSAIASKMPCLKKEGQSIVSGDWRIFEREDLRLGCNKGGGGGDGSDDPAVFCLCGDELVCWRGDESVCWWGDKLLVVWSSWFLGSLSGLCGNSSTHYQEDEAASCPISIAFLPHSHSGSSSRNKHRCGGRAACP